MPMALVDIFSPVWKVSDPKQRLEAVLEHTDVTVLRKVAEKDENIYVRLAAISRIEAEELREDLYEKLHIDLDVIEKETYQPYLEIVALYAQSNYARGFAIKKLVDKSLIRHVAMTDDDKFNRAEAAKLLRNNDDLITIIEMNPAMEVRLAALQHLTDQTVIKRLAENDESEEVRRAAVYKVHDPMFLQMIRDNEESEHVRNAARIQMNDPNVKENSAFMPKATEGSTEEQAPIKREYKTLRIELSNDDDVVKVEPKKDNTDNPKTANTMNVAVETKPINGNGHIVEDVALHAKERKVRLAALEKVEDEGILLTIALDDPDKVVRRSAAWRLNSNNSINELVSKCDDAEVLRVVLHKTTSTSLLKDRYALPAFSELRSWIIARMESDRDLLELWEMEGSTEMKEMILSRIGDEKVCYDLLPTIQDAELKNQAFWKIRQPQLLGDLALKTDDAELALMAIRRIEDENVLVTFALDTQHTSLRKNAIGRISGKDALKRLAIEAEEVSTRKAAVEKLTEVA